MFVSANHEVGDKVVIMYKGQVNTGIIVDKNRFGMVKVEKDGKSRWFSKNGSMLMDTNIFTPTKIDNRFHRLA